jgi:hypothetical protein
MNSTQGEGGVLLLKAQQTIEEIIKTSIIISCDKLTIYFTVFCYNGSLWL